MNLARTQMINILETLKLEWGELAPPEDNICDALDYAISDMKKLEKIEGVANIITSALYDQEAQYNAE